MFVLVSLSSWLTFLPSGFFLGLHAFVRRLGRSQEHTEVGVQASLVAFATGVPVFPSFSLLFFAPGGLGGGNSVVGAHFWFPLMPSGCLCLCFPKRFAQLFFLDSLPLPAIF